MYQGRGRKLNRLKGYDYSRNGWYFVTICAKERECLFGNIVVGTGFKPVPTLRTGFKPVPTSVPTFGRPEMVLNETGKIVVECWQDLPNHYPNCRLDEFVVMPNHLHGIVVIDCDSATVGTGFKPVPTTATVTLSEIIRGLKTFSARKINEIRQTPGLPVWQRSFHDHIIRNEKSYWQIKKYIQNNPLNWLTDRNNPINL